MKAVQAKQERRQKSKETASAIIRNYELAREKKRDDVFKKVRSEFTARSC